MLDYELLKNEKQTESVVYKERTDSVRVKNSHMSTREYSRRELHPFIRPWICSAIIGLSFLISKNLSSKDKYYLFLAALVCKESTIERSWLRKKPILGSLSALFFLVAGVGLIFAIKFLVKHPTVSFWMHEGEWRILRATMSRQLIQKCQCLRFRERFSLTKKQRSQASESRNGSLE